MLVVIRIATGCWHVDPFELPALFMAFAATTFGGEPRVHGAFGQMESTQALLGLAALVHHTHWKVIRVAWIATGGAARVAK